MFCSLIALLLANSPISGAFLGFWKLYFGPLNIGHWVNDGLMAIFFLLIGLELKREFYSGELSNPKTALLPIVAALGGIALPALIYFGLNRGLPTQVGFGIPMATDIAFALSIMTLVGSRVPISLKIFLTAIAVIDDLCAIIVIALFYTSKFSPFYLLMALGVLGVLVVLNRMQVVNLVFYLLGGALMWFFMLESGVHATIAGVLLAFAIPSRLSTAGGSSPAGRLEYKLHKPVAFGILPVFALANAGILIGSDWLSSLTSPNSTGIMAGLLIGKVVGVCLFSFVAVKAGVCRLPTDVGWKHVIGAGWLAGIGFTMSIFITNLAFSANAQLINSSKMAVLLSSFIAGLIGYLWLVKVGGQQQS